MTGPKPRSASLPTAQVGTVVLWFVLASVPGSLARVPDALVEVLIPMAMTVLCGVGILTLARARRSNPALVAGTVLCATCLLIAAALVVLVPTSLPNF
ncbi:hypothetical protein [Nocardioides acrostichi]|uniref:Uncharacterized protein n=1 Tax=Nocardioides acrostichi TaxID=2784339 RepID=A0A930V1X4_9ACTN|nr:hypothetical protein [Nocardioides acrostichi]MBF4161704.1 hypothetical protein [Nocardioides acrostichi]